MKNKSSSEDQPMEEEIREYAHHLYVSSGWLPGRDLDNWLAAEAHLVAERKGRRPGAKRPRHRAARAESETSNTAAPALDLPP